MITIKNNGYIWLLRPWLFVPPSISTCLRSKTTLHLLSNGYVYNPFPVSLLHNFYIHLIYVSLTIIITEIQILQPNAPLFWVPHSKNLVFYIVFPQLFLYPWSVCHIFLLLSLLLTIVSYPFQKYPISWSTIGWRGFCLI